VPTGTKIGFFAFKISHSQIWQQMNKQTNRETVERTSKGTKKSKIKEPRVMHSILVSCRCRQGVEQSAVNSHCCDNPAFIPSIPENSSIHRTFPTILVTLSAF